MQITHTKEKFVKVFNINSLGVHHDFYVQDNTLLLADVFENFNFRFYSFSFHTRTSMTDSSKKDQSKIAYIN